MDAVSSVRRRCVLYVSGFDPKGAGHYHALHRDQLHAWSAQQGVPVQVGQRKRLPSGNAVWTVKAGADPVQTHTEVEFLRWDDVVRDHWPKSTLSLWWQAICASVFNIWHGSLWRMYRLSWPPAVALAMPFALLLAVALGMPVAGWGVGAALFAAGGHLWMAVAGGLVAALAVGRLGQRLEARFSMYWMMRSYAFTALQAQGRVPELERRLDEHAARLRERIQTGGFDEVLLVGHSSGAIMASIVLARALQCEPGLGRCGPTLSFLTLGQWLPLLGLLPMADRFRRELGVISATDGVNWIDFSAPPDGCCFALCDPFAACGVPHRPGQGARFKLLNPRFADMFEPEAYRSLKRDRFNLHFQYLKFSPRETDYDYLAIISGHRRLWERYAHLQGVVDYDGLKPFRKWDKQ